MGFERNELSLKNIENATKEQRESGLYDWAKFFAAATWEVMNQNPSLSAAEILDRLKKRKLYEQIQLIGLCGTKKNHQEKFAVDLDFFVVNCI